MPDLATAILASVEPSMLVGLGVRADAAGYERTTLGPLLVVRAPRSGLDGFLLACASSLTATEAAATRVLVLDTDLDAMTVADVLAPALTAPTLAMLGARSLHGHMLDALERGEGAVSAYQPVIEISTGRPFAFEALLRFEHAGREVPPLEVFQAAADAGRLAAADAAARRAAIRGAAGWIGGRSLFLNLLPATIAKPDDVEATVAMVDEAGLDRRQIVFEASLAGSGDPRHLVRVLEHLRARGFGIAIDDVTDDRNVLAVVERLAPDLVKIARAVIKQLPGLQARSAVATIVGIANAAGCNVVAKGIETRAQLDAVVFVGVDRAQGWEVGQPMRPPGARPAVAS